MTLTTQVRKVTPDIAEEWLERNTSNRPVNNSNVAVYARDMAAGNWKLNGETVKFAENGILLDGQNRLLAVVRSNATVEMLIVEGLPNDSFYTIDTNTPRTAAQMMQMSELVTNRDDKDSRPLATRAARVTNAYIGLSQPNPTLTRKISYAETLETFKEHPEFKVLMSGFPRPFPGSDATVLAVGILALKHTDTKTVYEFLRLLNQEPGTMDAPSLSGKDNAIAWLRESLDYRSEKGLNVSYSQRMAVAAITVKGFNSWMNGEYLVQRISHRKGSKFPKFEF